MTAVSVTHIGELPEVRRYHDDGKHNFMLHGGFGIRYIRESIADAALAAAGREVERLRDILSLRDSDLAHFEKSVEDAAAALEVCDVTLAELNRMLLCEWQFHTDDYPEYDDYFTDLRESAELAAEKERSELCDQCIHFLSAFSTCAIGPAATCRRWPGTNCRLTPTRFRARAEKGSETL